MARKQDRCRDCEKCTERDTTALVKKMANAMLILCTLGLSVLGAKMINSGRRNCPQCGHPLTMHATVGGRFKD